MDCAIFPLWQDKLAKTLAFFREDAQKKWPLKGSKHADNLDRCQVSVYSVSFP
jgi:hypothetical protein